MGTVNNVPSHLALLPDGNRRWSKKHNLAVSEGHRRGLIDVAPRIVEASIAHGVHTVTLFPFSSQNWSRCRNEVAALLSINAELVHALRSVARRHSARVIHLGRKDRLPATLRESIEATEAETARGRDHVINLAVDYDGLDEIHRATLAMLEDARSNPGRIAPLTVTGLDGWLDTAGQPHPRPDFVIRTAEHRLSGFMAYQAAYAELYFSPLLWPDFDENALSQALADFSARERRFGR